MSEKTWLLRGAENYVLVRILLVNLWPRIIRVQRGLFLLGFDFFSISSRIPEIEK